MGVTWNYMSTENKQRPYKPLGSHLKQMREKRKETLAEVSGAVEIDADMLVAFEEGIERPVEDILLLLISHFSAKEDQATKLWELAGYDQTELPTQHMINNPHGQVQNGVVVLPADSRIVYTDKVHVMVNNYGVIMNFMQTAVPGNQPMAVSRIGMSKEHARSVLEVLQKTLSLQSPKAIQPNNTKLPRKKSDK